MESNEGVKIARGIMESIKMASFGKKLWALFIIILLILAASSGSIFEINDAGFITVKQSLLTGKVSIITEPGVFCQCYGKITKYPEAVIYAFNGKSERPAATRKKEREASPNVTEEIQVRFNDGAIAWISGTALFDLPRDKEKLYLIHKKFHNYDQLLKTGIVPVIDESIGLTAALMSSIEAYKSKRATFSQWAKDQVENGIYITEIGETEDKDPRTGQVIKNIFVKIRMEDGKIVRKENPIDRYGITAKQFQVTDIRYEPDMAEVIKKKRDTALKTEEAKAKAAKAIQERLTAEEEGKKEVMIAEYKAMVQKRAAEIEAEEDKAVAVVVAQKKLEVARKEKEEALLIARKKVELAEADKARATVEAQKNLEVAKLSARAASENKKTQVLEGQGMAEKKKLIYEADGALQQKLDAYVEVMGVLGKELGKQKWVPEITMGGAGGQDGNMAMNFMNMWMLKVARDLGVEMAVDKGNHKTAR